MTAIVSLNGGSVSTNNGAKGLASANRLLTAERLIFTKSSPTMETNLTFKQWHEISSNYSVDPNKDIYRNVTGMKHVPLQIASFQIERSRKYRSTNVYTGSYKVLHSTVRDSQLSSSSQPGQS